MKIEVVKSEGLAHNSYYLQSKGEAAIVDPRRDCKVYTQLAARDCATIKYIFETHRNEDYVIGSVELKNNTEAQIGHSKELPFKYGDLTLGEGDTFSVGEAKIKALYTPGHTNESLCYIVFEREEAQAVFTGDTLFAGSVGRTDLYGKEAQPTQAEKLYGSLHEKLLQLGDGVIVYPAHGAGSVCGSQISGHEPTTIGYEKKTNPYLGLSKEQFAQKSENTKLFVPHYFKQMEALNLNGPPLLSGLANPKPFGLAEFEWEIQEQNMIVVDTRQPYAFSGSHIPNSLSMWLEGASAYPGWVMDINQYVVFVLERPADIDSVTAYFRRVGFVNMCGYLCGGMNTWQEAGRPFRSFSTMTVTELTEKLSRDEVTLLDVREPHEWTEDGYIEGAMLIPFAELQDKADSISKDKSIAVTCSVGNRTNIALSILERAGFRNLINVLGGMTAWTNLKYPVKKEL
ncbi:MAG: MBL fold metallo-hydrolase [Candidatus Bathyarchaeia archaeon]|jgi:hydroxyacylglutathione hydrolase